MKSIDKLFDVFMKEQDRINSEHEKAIRRINRQSFWINTSILIVIALSIIIPVVAHYWQKS
tara:strand:+ start:1031 stop:1213 length:183 start_codon:yes stop_codon:yes gene_type:complete